VGLPGKVQGLPLKIHTIDCPLMLMVGPSDPITREAVAGFRCR
jgi:hypothetical protein